MYKIGTVLYLTTYLKDKKVIIVCYNLMASSIRVKDKWYRHKTTKNRIKLYTIKSKQLKNRTSHKFEGIQKRKQSFRACTRTNLSNHLCTYLGNLVNLPNNIITRPDQRRQRHVCLTVSKQYGCVRAREWCSEFCWPIQKSSNQTTNHPSIQPSIQRVLIHCIVGVLWMNLCSQPINFCRLKNQTGTGQEGINEENKVSSSLP